MQQVSFYTKQSDFYKYDTLPSVNQVKGEKLKAIETIYEKILEANITGIDSRSTYENRDSALKRIKC